MGELSGDPKNPVVKKASSSFPAEGTPSVNSEALSTLDKDKGVGSSSAVVDDENYSKLGDNKLGSEKAPVPGNCCNFSTITCSKFWAIFNLVQLFLCWISECAIRLTLFLGDPNPKHDETVFQLFLCMQGGSAGAQNTRLAFQIILLLVYTAGSILFILANFPTTQVVSQRPLFVKIYIWTIITFLLIFAIPFIFHLPIGECYHFISLTLWSILIIKMSIGLAVAYFSWSIAKLFRIYLNETAPESPDNKEHEGKDGNDATSASPHLSSHSSKIDFLTPPPTPKPSLDDG